MLFVLALIGLTIAAFIVDSKVHKLEKRVESLERLNIALSDKVKYLDDTDSLYGNGPIG